MLICAVSLPQLPTNFLKVSALGVHFGLVGLMRRFPVRGSGPLQA